MDDERFFNDVAILNEAGRLDPIFANQVLEAATDERIDELVEQGRKIIDEHSDQAWV
jgi:hypothetical protein